MPRIPEPERMDLPHEAEAYARADFADVNQRFVDRLLQLAVAAPPDLTLLDLGTGPGDIPRRIAAARPNWHIVAADAAEAMLAIAQRETQAPPARDAIRWTRCDAKALPFASAAFDAVVSNSILHHITETAALWSEVRRVARPRALVFFRDLARPESNEAAARIVRQYARNESPTLQEEFLRSLLSAYTVDEVREQLARAGLESLNAAMITDRHLDIWGRLP